MLFDSHAHYDDDRFDQDRAELLLSMEAKEVSYVVNISSDVPSLKKTLQLAETYPFIFAAVGIHPHNAGDINENLLETVKMYAENPKVVAIGEIGLDYHYDFAPRELQQYWFARQIELAKELKLPIIIHDREAHDDILTIVKKHNAGEYGGIFHCFSGDITMANIVLDLNFHISVGGPVTFKKSKELHEVIRNIPLDRLLIETDSPYLTPEPFRGKRNDSSYIRLVAEKIAAIREMTLEDIAKSTSENAKRLFAIS